MSKIEELIQKLCPNGVEYKKLGDICNVVTGGEAPLDCRKGNNKDNVYRYPVWGNGMDVYGYAKDYKINKDATVISSIGANTGAVYYHKAFFTPIVRLKVLLPKTDKLSSRFIYYSLNTVEIKSNSSSVPNMNATAIKKIVIPVPPVEIQQEIVRILDKFSALSEKLNAELELRKKQYEYYREKLISLSETSEARQKTLGEVCEFINGRAYKQDELLNEGKYKVLRVGNFFTNDKWYYSNLELSEDKYCKKGDLLYAWSASFGPKIWDKDKTIFHYHVWNIKYNTSLLLKKYLYYFLENDVKKIKSSTTGATMIHVSMQSMKKREIVIPSLLEQERIVSILDKFDTLVNDQEKGLPAEIRKVQQQYEYYRDKLLTF